MCALETFHVVHDMAVLFLVTLKFVIKQVAKCQISTVKRKRK